MARPYAVECHACAASFDALSATWCTCIVKERSLVCPSCEQCFCRADVEYKRKFWTEAPEALWDRKQRQAREQWALPANPTIEEAKRPLVLVVDDDREVRAVAAHLIDQWGFGCIHAANGAEALALANIYKPDVILTDALMPKMDGRELCRKIKADPELARTKVIIMSSVYTSGRFKREALSQFKADEFVSKPIDTKVLYRLVGNNGDETRTKEEPAEPAPDAWVPGDAPHGAETLLSVAQGDTRVAVNPLAVVDVAADDEDAETETEIDAGSSLTASQLIYLRALGLDGEIAALAKRVRGFAAKDLIALRAAGIPMDFVHAIELEPADTIGAPELITLFSTGCDAETINVLRRLGFTVSDIVGVVAAEVPLSFLREVMEIGGRRLSSTEIMRLHGAAVDLLYLRTLQANGYAESSVDDWIRLWTVGVPADFIETAARSLKARCSPTELLRLWLTGVDVALMREISAES